MKNSIIFVLILLCSSSCDLQRMKKCEWYLEPDLKSRYMVKPGWVSLCARNFKIGKQKCMLQSKLEFAKKNYNKKFKLSSMKLNKKVSPRIVLSIEVCE